MYTATILSKKVDKSTTKLEVEVEFTDGTSIVRKVFSFPPQTPLEIIKETANRFRLGLEKSETAAGTVTVGPVDFTGVEDGVETPADQTRRLWFKKWTKLLSVQVLIDHGILTGNEPQVLALRESLKDTFKIEYINSL